MKPEAELGFESFGQQLCPVLTGYSGRGFAEITVGSPQNAD